MHDVVDIARSDDLPAMRGSELARKAIPEFKLRIRPYFDETLAALQKIQTF